MKIDKNFLEEIIKESLEELQEEEVVEQGDLPGMKQLHTSIEELQRTIQDLEAENERLQKELDNQQSALSSDQVAPMQESFQITKGRLRQIISEEMSSAKKQGLI